MVEEIETTMVNIRLSGRIYPKHETRDRPHFEEYAIPPEILSNNNIKITLPDYDVAVPIANPPEEHLPKHRSSMSHQISPQPRLHFLRSTLYSSIQ